MNKTIYLGGEETQAVCQNCVFWLADENDHGICRRYPPTSILDATQTMISQFPLVKNEWCCGEWKINSELLK